MDDVTRDATRPEGDAEAIDADVARQRRLARTRKRLLLGFGAVVLVAGAIGAAWYLFVGSHHVTTDNAYVQGDVVEVTPQVAGMVVRILVEDTQRVEAGQVLVELDATDQRTARARAEAELARAVRDVEGLYASTDALQAQADARRAEIAAAQSAVTRAKADLARRRDVAQQGAVSLEEIAHAEQQYRTAEAQLAAARGAAQAALQQVAANRVQTEGVGTENHPRVLAAAAAVREAIVAEGRTRVLAPVDGEIAKRAVTLGTRVTPGTPLLAIVPLERVWVEANFKEGQLRNVRPGQAVTLEADLYGGRVEYRGRVVGLGAGTGSAFALLPAQNATGNWIKVVQRVPVRIALDPAQLREHPLRVGLSMRADVDTRAREGGPVEEAPAVVVAGGTDVYAELEKQAEARIREIVEAQHPARTARLAGER
jgi:membrane fusion protein (multidrug efflux system)